MERFRRSSIFLACSFICFIAGCRTDCSSLFCEKKAEIPPNVPPPPTGTYACVWQNTQEALAERDDFIIYQYEWKGESAELGPFGRRHLAGLIQRLVTQPSLIFVEPSEFTSLDLERQAILTTILEDAGMSDARMRVHIGYGAAEGLHGQEATRLEQGYFRSGSSNGGISSGSGRTGGY